MIAKMQVRRTTTGKTIYHLWCPACDDLVAIDDSWSWNGDLDRPTFSPSLLTRYRMGGVERRCHSFVTDGVWRYLPDCTHDRAGQQVPMVDLPEWVLADDHLNGGGS